MFTLPQRLPGLDRVDQMIALGVGRVGVDEVAQATVVQRQPGNQSGEILVAKEIWLWAAGYKASEGDPKFDRLVGRQQFILTKK